VNIKSILCSLIYASIRQTNSFYHISYKSILSTENIPNFHSTREEITMNRLRPEFPIGAREAGFWAHPTTYRIGTWVPFHPREIILGVKLTTHLHHSRGQQCVDSTSTSSYAFMACYSIKCRDDFTFTLTLYYSFIYRD
jgi:hypothetical protein